MTSPEERRRKVGREVEARIAQITRSQAEIAREAGISPKTLRALIRGQRWPTARVRARVESALGWPAGEMVRVAECAATGLTTYSMQELVAELCRRVRPSGHDHGQVTVGTERGHIP